MPKSSFWCNLSLIFYFFFGKGSRVVTPDFWFFREYLTRFVRFYWIFSTTCVQKGVRGFMPGKFFRLLYAFLCILSITYCCIFQKGSAVSHRLLNLSSILLYLFASLPSFKFWKLPPPALPIPWLCQGLSDRLNQAAFMLNKMQISFINITQHRSTVHNKSYNNEVWHILAILCNNFRDFSVYY